MSRAQIAALLGGAILLVGVQACSHATLSFFFDGVPEPGSEIEVTEVAEGPQAGTEPGSPGAEALGPQGSVHQPMKERNCRACHQVGTLRLRKSPEDGLCSDCHRDLLEEITFVHGPAAVEGCTACHVAHESRHPHLLVAAGEDLCITCHEREDLGAHPHQTLEEPTDCLTCHRGHGGHDRFFLR